MIKTTMVEILGKLHGNVCKWNIRPLFPSSSVSPPPPGVTSFISVIPQKYN